MSESCDNCKFYKPEETVFFGELSGKDICITNMYCKRFPAYQRREQDDWCGEWQPIKTPNRPA